MQRNFAVPTFPSSFSSRMEFHLGEICHRCFMLLWICHCHMNYTIFWNNAAYNFNFKQTQGLLVSVGDPDGRTCKIWYTDQVLIWIPSPKFSQNLPARAKLLWIDVDIQVVHNVLWTCLDTNNKVNCCSCMWCTSYRLWPMAQSLWKNRVACVFVCVYAWTCATCTVTYCRVWWWKHFWFR
jgi:hypothetical protein